MKLINFLILMLASASGSYAQNWIGLNQSNYNGANAFYFNTAMAVSSPYQISANAMGTSMHLDNNFLTYKMPFSFTQWIKGTVPDEYRNDDGRISFKRDWFEEDLNGKDKTFDLNIETRGPASMYNFDRKAVVGFFSRTRIGVQGFGISEDLARIFKNGLDSSNNVIYDPPNQIQFGNEINGNEFTVNINSFSEIGVGGGLALINKPLFKFSVGANIKYLMGTGTGYVKNNGTSFKVNGYDSINFGKTDFEYGYVDPGVFNNLNTLNFFNGKVLGGGFGVDLSAYVEIKRYHGKIGMGYHNEIPDVEYFFRGGFSIMDIGSISYNTDVIARHITNSTPKTWVANEDFAFAWAGGMATGMEYMDSTIKSMFNIEEKDNISAPLPTTLMLHGDLRIIPKLYIGAQIIQSLRGQSSVAFRRPSSLTLVPRFEIKGFEISAPLNLYNDYKSTALGAFLRFGPFFIGTDNLVSSINRSEFKGFNYYFGLSHGFGNSKKDVSNNYK